VTAPRAPPDSGNTDQRTRGTAPSGLRVSGTTEREGRGWFVMGRNVAPAAQVSLLFLFLLYFYFLFSFPNSKFNLVTEFVFKFRVSFDHTQFEEITYS
jgi:hypothetical protein